MLNNESFYYILDIISLMSKNNFSVEIYWNLYQIIKAMFRFGVKI